MNWEDGDFAEELPASQKDEFDQFPAYYCPGCKKETDLWFDRTVGYLPDCTYVGMKDRCTECGMATDEVPADTPSFKDDIGEAENDGG
jgi:hypothetical protein